MTLTSDMTFEDILPPKPVANIRESENAHIPNSD